MTDVVEAFSADLPGSSPRSGSPSLSFFTVDDTSPPPPMRRSVILRSGLGGTGAAAAGTEEFVVLSDGEDEHVPAEPIDVNANRNSKERPLKRRNLGTARVGDLKGDGSGSGSGRGDRLEKKEESSAAVIEPILQTMIDELTLQHDTLQRVAMCEQQNYGQETKAAFLSGNQDEAECKGSRRDSQEVMSSEGKDGEEEEEENELEDDPFSDERWEAEKARFRRGFACFLLALLLLPLISSFFANCLLIVVSNRSTLRSNPLHTPAPSLLLKEGSKRPFALLPNEQLFQPLVVLADQAFHFGVEIVNPCSTTSTIGCSAAHSWSLSVTTQPEFSHKLTIHRNASPDWQSSAPLWKVSGTVPSASDKPSRDDENWLIEAEAVDSKSGKLLQRIQLPLAVRIRVMPAIGLDLVGTEACVAVLSSRGGDEQSSPTRLSTIPLSQHGPCLPLEVRLSEQGVPVAVGHRAKDLPPIARLLKFDGLLKRPTDNLDGVHDVVESDKKTLMHFRALSLLLRSIKQKVSEHLFEARALAPLPCVVVVPTFLSHVQRTQLLQAARLAGWKVSRLIHAPTAVALSRDYQSPAASIPSLVVRMDASRVEATWLETETGQLPTTCAAECKPTTFSLLQSVWNRTDCGDTAEVSSRTYRAVAIESDAGVSEKAVNRLVHKELHEKIKAIEPSWTVLTSEQEHQLSIEAERVKVALAAQPLYVVRLCFFMNTWVLRRTCVQIDLTVTREDFQTWTLEVFNRAMSPIRRVLSFVDAQNRVDAQTRMTTKGWFSTQTPAGWFSPITPAGWFSAQTPEMAPPPFSVFAIGDSFSLPFARKLIQDTLTASLSAPTPFVMNPILTSHALATGAAVACKQSHSQAALVDVLPVPIGIRLYPFIKDVPADVRGSMKLVSPASSSSPASASASASVGERVFASDFHRVIPQNTPFPTEQSWQVNLSTALPWQTQAVIEVFEGFSFDTRNNDFLGRFVIPLTPARTSNLTLVFRISTSGVLRVTSSVAGDASQGLSTTNLHLESAALVITHKDRVWLKQHAFNLSRLETKIDAASWWAAQSVTLAPLSSSSPQQPDSGLVTKQPLLYSFVKQIHSIAALLPWL